jgi:hypothetical protein
MLRRLLAIAFLPMCLLAAAPARADAFDTACEAEARSAVAVETRFDPGEVLVDTSRSAADLTAMKSLGGRWRTSGLTTMSQQLGIRAWTRVLQSPDGRGCALPRFEITLVIQPQHVYVGREFARGSCSFDEILAHEMRHVRANREHAARVAASFEGQLRLAFAESPVRGDPASLNARVLRMLEADWLPRLKRALEAGDAAHPAIDTEEEFHRLSQACGGEVAALLSPQARR